MKGVAILTERIFHAPLSGLDGEVMIMGPPGRVMKSLSLSRFVVIAVELAMVAWF